MRSEFMCSVPRPSRQNVRDDNASAGHASQWHHSFINTVHPCDGGSSIRVADKDVKFVVFISRVIFNCYSDAFGEIGNQ